MEEERSRPGKDDGQIFAFDVDTAVSMKKTVRAMGIIYDKDSPAAVRLVFSCRPIVWTVLLFTTIVILQILATTTRILDYDGDILPHVHMCTVFTPPLGLQCHSPKKKNMHFRLRL